MTFSQKYNYFSRIMLKITMFLAATASFANYANSTIINCKYGALSNAPNVDRSCGTRDMGTSPYQNQECDDRTHSCLTAAYAGDWYAAYGCYPDNVIEGTKIFIQRACAADETCSRYNSDGIPANGWQECKTNDCNACNSASISGPSTLLLMLGASVAGVTLV